MSIERPSTCLALNVIPLFTSTTVLESLLQLELGQVIDQAPAGVKFKVDPQALDRPTSLERVDSKYDITPSNNAASP